MEDALLLVLGLQMVQGGGLTLTADALFQVGVLYGVQHLHLGHAHAPIRATT